MSRPKQVTNAAAWLIGLAVLAGVFSAIGLNALAESGEGPSTLRTLFMVQIGLSVVQVLAGIGILRGLQVARVAGIVLAVLSVISWVADIGVGDRQVRSFVAVAAYIYVIAVLAKSGAYFRGEETPEPAEGETDYVLGKQTQVSSKVGLLVIAGILVAVAIFALIARSR